jgi:hypothetical protein
MLTAKGIAIVAEQRRGRRFGKSPLTVQVAVRGTLLLTNVP